jgi:hypothetical protein
MKPRHIEIHVEEMVLHGVDPSDRHAVGDAVVAELTRLIAEGGLPDTMQVDAAGLRGAVEGSPASGAALGVAVARATYRGAPR